MNFGQNLLRGHLCKERSGCGRMKTKRRVKHCIRGSFRANPLLKYSPESIAKTFFCKLANFKEAALRQHRFPTLHFLTMLAVFGHVIRGFFMCCQSHCLTVKPIVTTFRCIHVVVQLFELHILYVLICLTFLVLFCLFASFSIASFPGPAVLLKGGLRSPSWHLCSFWSYISIFSKAERLRSPQTNWNLRSCSPGCKHDKTNVFFILLLACAPRTSLATRPSWCHFCQLYMRKFSTSRSSSPYNFYYFLQRPFHSTCYKIT